MRGENTDLNGKLKVLEESQQELEKNLVAVQLQHQQDNSKLQTQLDEAERRSKALQKEVHSCQGLGVSMSELTFESYDAFY